jgi:hypothetical protein
MIYLVAAMSCIVAAITAFWCYASYARWDLNRLAALEKWSDCYFDSAATFAASKETPFPLLEDILGLSRSLDDPRTSRKLLKILKDIPVGRIRDDPRRAEIFEFLQKEKLSESYLTMGKSYIFTISFKDRVRGPWIRKFLASALKQRSELTKSSNLENPTKKLLIFNYRDMIQLFDFERVLIDQMFPFDRDVL